LPPPPAEHRWRSGVLERDGWQSC